MWGMVMSNPKNGHANRGGCGRSIAPRWRNGVDGRAIFSSADDKAATNDGGAQPLPKKLSTMFSPDPLRPVERDKVKHVRKTAYAFDGVTAKRC